MDNARELFAWLVALEAAGVPTERQAALRNGYALAQLAVTDGLVASDEHGHGQIAMLLGELRHDGWVRWDWQEWPTDDEPRLPRLFQAQHLQRMDNLRLTPEGYAAAAGRKRLIAHTTGAVNTTAQASEDDELRDVFISHASEDKDEIARPLTDALIALGYTVWFDEYELTLGDSLSERIDSGLASSRFGVVIISHAFLSKPWPKRELRGLVANEMSGGEKVILPVWHGVEHADVVAASPPLGDLLAASSDDGVELVADRVARAIERRRGLERAGARPAAARQVSAGAVEDRSDLREDLIGLIRASDKVGMRELLRREQRKFEGELFALLRESGDRLDARADPEELSPVEDAMWTTVERRLATLMPMVEYDNEGLASELRALARFAERHVPTRSSFSAWREGHRWSVWMLVWTLGPAALAGEHTDSLRSLWTTHTREGSASVPLPAMRQLGGAELGPKLSLARFQKTLALDGLWHLAFRLSGSDFINSHYPELLQGPSPDLVLGSLSRAGDWAYLMTLVSGHQGGTVAVPQYWRASQVQLTLADRLQADGHLRTALANSLLDSSDDALVDLPNLIERARGPREFI